MAKPISKAIWQVSSPKQVPDLLGRAFSVAASGRPGPVLLDIPMDVQRGQKIIWFMVSEFATSGVIVDGNPP